MKPNMTDHVLRKPVSDMATGRSMHSGRGLPGGKSLSFASPLFQWLLRQGATKESNQRKGDPGISETPPFFDRRAGVAELAPLLPGLIYFVSGAQTCGAALFRPTIEKCRRSYRGQNPKPALCRAKRSLPIVSALALSASCRIEETS